MFFFNNFGVVDGDLIGKDDFATILSSGIVGHHDLDFNSNNSLLEENMSNSYVNVIVSRLSSVDHVSGLELHGLSSLLLEFSGNDDLASSGSFVDNSSDDGVGGHSGGNH